MLGREFGYNPPISKDLQHEYETALQGVLRWRNGPWPDNVYETDLDHVTRMLFILSDIQHVCPTLSSEIHIPTVRDMIYMHDAGEILAGDLTHGRDDYETISHRWKEREYAAFRLLTQRIENPDVKLKARELYKRYIAKEDSDKEAQLANFIDKLQGARFGFKEVFNGRYLPDEARKTRMNYSVRLLSQPITALLKLVSPETQSDLKRFLKSEFERFAECGYEEEAAPYIEDIDSILNVKT